MTYGQVILILFVVLIGYYGFLIFMDIQHLKAAEAAAQENQSEEEIDITDEACSFQPQLVTRDDKKKEEEKKLEEAGNENASSKSGEDVPVSEETSSTENPSSETASQTQTAEPDNADPTLVAKVKRSVCCAVAITTVQLTIISRIIFFIG